MKNPLHSSKAPGDPTNEVARLRARVAELEQRCSSQSSTTVGISNIDSCTLLEGSPVCTKIVDMDSRLRYMSSAGIDGLKIPDITLHYDSIFPLDFYPEKTKAIIADHLERAKDGETSSTETPMNDMEGNEVWFHTTFVPAIDELTDAVKYIIVTSVDITARKLMEEQLLKNHKLESIGNLAGGIAHDFNNLLTVILGNIALVKSDHMLTPDIKEQLTYAENAGFQAQKLTQKLLTFSSGGKPVRSPIDTRKILIETTEFSLSGSPSTVTFDIAEDIPAINGDHGQISQVIQNLIINAEQAMPEGGALSVVATCPPDSTLSNHLPSGSGTYVRISISDEGPGISPGDQQRIFDPFYTTKREGSGLGLATVTSIVINHEGYVELESSPGKGACFHIYLPAVLDASTDPASAHPPLLPRQGHILVMDDDPFIRQYSADILKRQGFTVAFAAHGEEAIAAYATAHRSENPFDLVLLDLTIRGGLGGEITITRLHELNPDIRAIVFSGYANNPVLADYQAFGFQAGVSKPFTPDMLLRAVSTVLENSPAPPAS